MTKEIELAVTIAVLLAIVGGIAWSYYQAKQPPDPLKPRLINYPLMMIFLFLLFLAALAHVISLVTGQQVQPRRRRGM